MRGSTGDHHYDFPLVNQGRFWSPSGTDGQLFSNVTTEWALCCEGSLFQQQHPPPPLPNSPTQCCWDPSILSEVLQNCALWYLHMCQNIQVKYSEWINTTVNSHNRPWNCQLCGAICRIQLQKKTLYICNAFICLPCNGLNFNEMRVSEPKEEVQMPMCTVKRSITLSCLHYKPSKSP